MNSVYRVFLAFSVLCVCDSKKGYSGGRHGGHTTPRSRYTTHYSNNNYHTTQGSIGFDNFQNVQNRPPQTNYNPSAPQLPQQPAHYNPQQPAQGIGFENFQNRPPQNPTYQQGGIPYHQGGTPYQQGGTPYHQGNPPYQQGGTPYQPGGTPYQQGGTPYQNHPNYNANQHQYNSYQPPPSYYNPNYNTPGGMPPPIYQPVQQSSGGSVLGYAGSFAGGLLLGHLATNAFSGGGGGGGSGENREYTVHHYHNNANEVPKQVSVNSNGLITCSQNETDGLCAPNTFPMCLSNGTIMCVTHSAYTTPCNSNNSMPCVVTLLPCTSNDSSCNTTTAMYVPCISNVTVVQQTVLNFTSDNSVSNQPSMTTVEYCITAIAEPKLPPSAAASYFEYLMELAKNTYEMVMNLNNTSNSTSVYGDQNKTEVTTLFPGTNNGTNAETTTLPYNN